MRKQNKTKLLVSFLFVIAAAVAGTVYFLWEEKPEQKSVEARKKTVHVYFFEGFDRKLGEKTIAQLNEIFDSVAFEGTIPLPDSAYYARNKRYKADILVKHLRQLQPDSKELVIGFSPKDISGRVHGYDDFGVMGWTRISIHASVVSPYRVGKRRVKEDFIKLVLHELGHADGLHHCNNSETCYLVDAKGRNPLPKLTGFCEKCSDYLTKKHWSLPK